MHETKKSKMYLMGVIGMLTAVFLDQFTKVLAVTHLKGNEPFVLMEGVFELHYLENQGAAFGLMQGKKAFFLIIGVLLLAAIVYYYIKLPATKRFVPIRVCAVMLSAGAIGNMIDRIRLDYVVDFFYFKLIDFPIFNVADIYVTVTTCVLFFLILFYYKDEEADLLFSFGREKKDKKHE